MPINNIQTSQDRPKYNYTFTVFTATHNRAHSLHLVYDSLKAQTYRDFEWSIVDDASQDNTRELVQQWQQENLIPIRYVYQPHGHKHIAFSRGVKAAKGELFLNFDSDDYCDPNALERFKYHWDTIPADQKEHFSAVTCLCKTITGKVVGSPFPFNPTDSNSLEIRYRFKVKGEKWGFQRTDVLREISYYEEFQGVFLPEGLFWQQIDRKYQTRFVNEALRTYVTEHVSLVNEKPQNMAIGSKIHYLSILNEQIQWFRFDPIEFLRLTIHYVRFSFHAGEGIMRQFTNIQTDLGKILWAVAAPIGSLVYFKDKLLYKGNLS
jgi:glycosyltransferase involved in cell wall biosynthesis